MNVMKWLLDSDPAIRWEVMRDLTDEGDKAVAIERSRVATEAWGARLLAHQSPRGYWGRRDDPGWMTTVWSLARLKDLERRHQNGRWPLNCVHNHLIPFDM